MDGEKETARKHRTKRNEIQQKITSISAGSLSTLQGELSGAQAEVSAMINEALSHVYKRYPQLDANDSSANPQMINIINNMATQKRKDGSGVFDALMDAIDEGVLLLQLKPKGEVAEDKTKQKKVAEKRNKKATERRIDAVKKPKRKANSPRKPSTRINPKEVHKMSEADFSSKEGRQALNQEFGIRFDA